MTAPPTDGLWLAELLKSQHPRLLALCKYRLQNEQDALDACQETYLRAFLRVAKLRTAEQPERWLRETARRVCLESLRRRSKWTRTHPSRFQRCEEPAPIDLLGAQRWREQEAQLTTTSRAEDYYRHQRQQAEGARERAVWLLELAELLQLLGPDQREVMERTMDGLEPREIAIELGITEAAVHGRKHRAVQQISELWHDRREREDTEAAR